MYATLQAAGVRRYHVPDHQRPHPPHPGVLLSLRAGGEPGLRHRARGARPPHPVRHYRRRLRRRVHRDTQAVQDSAAARQFDPTGIHSPKSESGLDVYTLDGSLEECKRIASDLRVQQAYGNKLWCELLQY